VTYIPLSHNTSVTEDRHVVPNSQIMKLTA